MKDVFLSIDLDYWDCISWDNYTNYKPLIKRNLLFNYLIKNNIPVSIYLTHDKMLRQINESKCETIINIDFHSDLTSIEFRGDLSEGNIFSYVSNRKNKTYIWLMPYYRVGILDGDGRCDNPRYEGNVFLERNWVYKKQIKTTNPNILKLEKIKEVGVCISPDWINDSRSFLMDVIYPLSNNKIKQWINKDEIS